MKSKLFFAFALTLIFAKVNAQSFLLQTSNGSLLNNGDTVILSGNTNDFVLESALLVTNNSVAQKTVSVERTLLSLVAGNDNAFAWGVMMYPPSVNFSVTPSVISSGAIDSTFYTWYFINGFAGVSYIKYRFYDENNPADSAWMVFQFNVTQTTEINNFNTEKALTLFPNPSNGIYHISSSGIDSNAAAAVYNQTGNLVLLKSISGQSNHFKVDLTDQPNGVYLLKLKDEKNLSSIIYRLIKN